MDTPVVDFHNHLARWTRHGMVDDQDRYLRVMDAAGVDVACVNCIFFSDARRGNDVVARFVERRPDRFVPVAFVTPHYPEEAIAELERCFDELGAKFLKIYPAYAQRPIDDPAWVPIFEWCSGRGVAVMSHAQFSDGLPRTDGYTALSQQFPGVKWVWAHGGGGGPHSLVDAVKVGPACPNVYFETACNASPYGGLERLVEAVGADRVLFGSDMPLFDARQEVARVMLSDIPDESKPLVLGLNAIKLLGLDL
jgi:predicted TIM-barrel fold metal-dependent hydrolase